MTTPSWYEQGREHVWYPYTQMQDFPEPVRVTGAEGCYIQLEDGRALLDGISSWWSACHGYNHPYLVEAMSKQLQQISHVMFAGTAHQPAYDLCTRLAKMTQMDKVFLTDSGSTSVETSMKIAVQYWQNKGHKNKQKFVTFKRAYHGDTMGCMSLCDPDSGMHAKFGDYMPRQYSIPIPSDEYGLQEFDALLEGIEQTVAAVIIEPLVQGAGGMRFHSPDILAELYRITKQYDILFIADEIMTGFYRTGYKFACQEGGILPDIMCLGKALTGGMLSLAAVCTKQQIFDGFLGDSLEQALMSGPTFMANPLACSAANASLDLFEQEPRNTQVEAIEHQMYKELSICKTLPIVRDVRIKGALGVIQIDTNWQDIFAMRQEFLSHGVWLRPFADVLYLMPPLIISSEELTRLTKAVIDVLSTRSG